MRDHLNDGTPQAGLLSSAVDALKRQTGNTDVRCGLDLKKNNNALAKLEPKSFDILSK